MPNVFEVTDSFGRQIICTEDRWKFHILSHHPEMGNYLEDVKRAIQNPDLPISVDAERSDRNLYYGRQSGRPRYVKVVVKIEGDQGSVVTAFLADSPKSGEMPIWK